MVVFQLVAETAKILSQLWLRVARLGNETDRVWKTTVPKVRLVSVYFFKITIRQCCFTHDVSFFSFISVLTCVMVQSPLANYLQIVVENDSTMASGECSIDETCCWERVFQILMGSVDNLK